MSLALFFCKKGDTNFRRTWDKNEYKQKAHERELENRERDENEERRRQGKPPLRRTDPLDQDATSEKRTLLKQRDEKIDFSTVINTTQVVQATAGVKQAGFECKVCGIVVKDNANYLDHVNGWKHQRNLGMSMKVERSTAEQVKARLESISKRKAEPDPIIDLEARTKKAKEDEDELKRRRKEAKKKKKQEKSDAANAVDEPVGEIDPDMAAMMGFSGFGGMKKNI